MPRGRSVPSTFPPEREGGSLTCTRCPTLPTGRAERVRCEAADATQVRVRPTGCAAGTLCDRDRHM